LLVFFYGLVLSQIRVGVFNEQLEPKNAAGFFDYRGVTNVHTDQSGGSGTALEVIREAQEAGVDFLSITDHNIFEKSSVPEGYHRKLLVTQGAEYSYLDARLLTYERERGSAFDSLGQAQLYLADLLSQTHPETRTEMVVLAHPFKPGYSWTGPIPPGLNGIEVLNLKSIWQAAWMSSKISFLWSAVIYPFNPQLSLLRLYDEPEEELKLWDQLSMSRNTVAMAGADATAKTGSGGGPIYLKFPSYATSFSLISNHVLTRSELTGEAEGDRRKIFDALSKGQSYMCLDVLGNPKGFVAYIQDGERILPVGSRAKWVPGMKLIVKLPSQPLVPFETAFIKDGQHFMSSNSVDTEYEIHGPGVYRTIVRVFPTLSLLDGQRWLTWIYVNPFYLY
jgi:hypothetical protein